MVVGMQCCCCCLAHTELYPSISCIHNTILSVCHLPLRYPCDHIHRLYESVSMLSICALACIIAHPPFPHSLFSDTEKLTPPPPSLLARFCPLSRMVDKHFNLFTLSCSVLWLYLHFASLSRTTRRASQPVCSLHFNLHVAPPVCWSVNRGWCYSTESCLCLKIHCVPLIHCALHLSLSLPPFFSESFPGNSLFFPLLSFFMELYPAFPPPLIHPCVFVLLQFYVHLHFTWAVHTLQFNKGVIRQELTILHSICEWF